MIQADALVVGASISGLALAACLQKQGIGYQIIEKQPDIAWPWRKHYDRLHLHTGKRISHLPFKEFDRAVPRYPSRLQILAYLEAYQKEFNIKPVFNTGAKSIYKKDDTWLTETNHETIASKYIVMATGAFSTPKPVCFKGQETFPGTVIHSSHYKNGKQFCGQQVLVVGFGNSACEIAIDLYEQGATPFISVRSPVNIIPRDILGIPIVELSLLLSHLPPRVADALNAPVLRLMYGDITKLGLTKKTYGAFEEIKNDGTIPMLDIGTIQHIRKGHITVCNGIDYIEGNTIHFLDGKKESFDAIVACIGFTRNVADIVTTDENRFADLRVCTLRQACFGKNGLYFCGFWVGPTGHIREIASDAQIIAKDMAAKERLS